MADTEHQDRRNNDIAIARLEVKLENIENKLDTHIADESTVVGMVQALTSRFDKYEAKWGGIVLVVTVIGTFFAFFKDWLFAWLAK